MGLAKRGRTFQLRSKSSLATIRRCAVTRQAALLEGLLNCQVSRRDLLRMMTGASLTTSLFGPLARAATLFQVKSDSKSVLVSISGMPAFNLRVDQFDGTPILSCCHDSRSFVLGLTGARIPGTPIPAEFELCALHTGSGWEGSLVWPALAYHATFPFEQWLIGRPVAHSPINFHGIFDRVQLASAESFEGSEAIFLPSWTFEINPPRSAGIASQAGKLVATKLQLELVGPEEAPLLLIADNSPHTRLWASGYIPSAEPVTMSDLSSVTFTGEHIDSVLELKRGGENALAMESRVESGNAGYVHSSVSPLNTTEGYGANQLRVAFFSSGSRSAEAVLNTNARWYSRGGVHLEQSAVAETYKAVSDITGPKEGNFRVTRMIVPLSGVDQAMFLRIPVGAGGKPDIGNISFNIKVDRLDWFEGWHPFRRTVPLDEFELRLSRGSDALLATLRFHDISMQVSGGYAGLIGGEQARIEYEFGSQHVNEEAVYVTDLKPPAHPGQSSGDDQFISDEEICKFKGWNSSTVCENNLRKARADCTYDKLRKDAIAARKPSDIEIDLRRAKARFADSTWLTFLWNPDSCGQRRMDFSINALFDFESYAIDPKKSETGKLRLQPVVHKLAATTSVSITEQMRLQGEPTRAPKSLRERAGNDIRENATLIQAPYRLGLSPIGHHKWRLRANVVTSKPGLLELWSVRAEQIQLRAIWSPDYRSGFWANDYPHFPKPDKSIRAPLDGRDRHEIVALSSRFGERAMMGSAQVVPHPVATESCGGEVGIFVPQPLRAQLLLLSSHGASLRLKGKWAPPAHESSGALTVQFWDQNSQLGRDTKVVIEYKGYLVPLGQPATLVKETERRLVWDKNTKSMIARLVQRFYIRVTHFTRRIPALHQPFEGRGWPFGDITMRDYVSPDLDKPENSPIHEDLKKLGQQAFWPRDAVTGWLVDFPFEDTVTGVRARAPLVFVDNEIAHRPEMMVHVAAVYRTELEDVRRGKDVSEADPGNYCSLLKQSEPDGKPQPYVARIDSGKIRFAPDSKTGSTQYKASRFFLDIDIPSPAKNVDASMVSKPNCGALPEASKCSVQNLPGLMEELLVAGSEAILQETVRMSPPMEAENQPPFYPHLRQAIVEAGPLAVLSGGGLSESLVEIDSHYLQRGFDGGNTGEIYLRFVDNSAEFNFSKNTSNSGGFANPSTVIAAISRKRGPIGGAGELQPQVVRYRYDVSRQGILSTLQPIDPVSQARIDGADPREYFGKTLGQAKLCGVVAFADIVDVVLKASGARAPRILQEFEHSIPADVMRPAAETLRRDVINPLLVALTPGTSGNNAAHAYAPGIYAAACQVDALLAEAQNAPSAKLIALGGEIVPACKALRNEVNAAIEDPKVLLPADALGVIQTVIDLRNYLQALLSPVGIKQLQQSIIDGVSSALRQKLLDNLAAALVQNPRYAELLQQVQNVRNSLETLDHEARAGAEAFLSALPRELVRLLDGLVDVRGWSQWVDEGKTELRQLVLGYARGIVHTLNQKDDQGVTTVNHVKSGAASLKKKADLVKVGIEQTQTGLPATRVVERVVLEISETALAAVSHTEELEASLKSIGNIDSVESVTVSQVDRIAECVRATLDILSKLPRLSSLAKDIEHEAYESEVDGYMSQYAEWTETIAHKVLLPTLISLCNELNTAAITATKETLEPLNWLQATLKPAMDIANQLNGTDFKKLVKTINDYESSISSFYKLNAVLLAALDPDRTAKQALRATADIARNPVASEFAVLCGKLAEVIRPLHTEVNKVSLSDDGVLRWLSPPIRERIWLLQSGLGAISSAPAATEVDVRIYLEKFEDAKNAIIGLVHELARIGANGDLGSLIDVQRAIDAAMNDIGIPTSARLRFDWETEVNPYPSGSGPVFEPLGSRRLEIHSLAVADLRGKNPPEFTIDAKLDPFRINLFGDTPFLTIFFSPMIFSAGTGREAKLTVDVEHVYFSGQLSFVKSLQEWLREKFGMLVEPWSEGPGVLVGYSFNRDIIQATAFTLQNVGFNISCILPFNGEPARFRFGLSQPNKPFLVSAGIYGGGGYVGIQSRADTIEYIEASFEYGLVTAFKFGPAVGTGRITAGVYIRLADRQALISGFFNASGAATIAGLITVAAEFRVQIWYDGGTGRVAGAATFMVSFSISIVEYKYSVGVAYARQGGQYQSPPPRGSSAPAPAITVLNASAVPDGHAKTLIIKNGLGVDGLDAEQVAKLKNEAAKAIDPHDGSEFSLSLLKPRVWDRYWMAFEDGIDECR